MANGLTYENELQSFILAKETDFFRQFPNARRGDPQYNAEMRKWTNDGRTAIRRSVYQETLAQLNAAGIKGVVPREKKPDMSATPQQQTAPFASFPSAGSPATAAFGMYANKESQDPDDTIGPMWVDPEDPIHEFASLRQSQYERGENQIQWNDYQKNKFSKTQAALNGLVINASLAFEGSAGAIGAYLKQRSYAAQSYERFDPNTGDVVDTAFSNQLRASPPDPTVVMEEADKSRESWQRGAKAVAPYLTLGVSNLFEERRSKVLGPDAAAPSDIRERYGRGGGGAFVSTMEMTGSALGTIPYSIPALATRNPILAAGMTTPFFAMGYDEAFSRRMRIYEDQKSAAREFGLPAPAAPTMSSLNAQGFIGGVVEYGSEYTIDRLQVALPLLGRGSKLMGKSAEQSARSTATAAKELLDSMARRRGLLGVAKSGVMTAAQASTEGIEELVPEAAKEVTDLMFIPEGYENDFWSRETAEAGGTGFISGLIIGSTQQAFGKEAREYRRTRRQVRKAAEAGVGSVAGIILDKSARIASERLLNNATAAKGSTMAMSHLDEMAVGSRGAMLVDEDLADVTLTDDVLQRMRDLGVTDKPIGVFNGMLVFAPVDMVDDVQSAINNGDASYITGNETLVEPGKLISGALVVKNKAGQVVDVVPYNDNDAAASALGDMMDRASRSGNTVENVPYEGLATISETLALQVDSDAVMRKLQKPSERPPTARQTKRGIEALRLDIRNDAAGTKVSGGPSDGRFSSPYLTEKELGGAKASDVSVDVVLSEVSDENLTDGERNLAKATGVKPTILDAKVVFTINNPDGTTRKVEKSTFSQGAYLSQESPDGLFLIRENGSAFTSRNAFAVMMHELRHRLVGRSRAGAEYLAKTLYLDPTFAIRGGIEYMRSEDGSLAGLSDSEVVGYYSALHSAAIGTLTDRASYNAAVSVMNSETASEEEKQAASATIESYKAAKTVTTSAERFAEESAATAIESSIGKTATEAAMWEAVYKDSKSRSMRKYIAWVSNVLARNGFAGQEARQALYEIRQRLDGVSEAELQVDSDLRAKMEKKFRADMDRYEEMRNASRSQMQETAAPAPAKPVQEQPSVPQPGQPGFVGEMRPASVSVRPKGAPSSGPGWQRTPEDTGPAAYSRRGQPSASMQGIGVGGNDIEQQLMNAQSAIQEAQSANPEERNTALVSIVQALANIVPLLASTQASVSARTGGSPVQAGKLVFPSDDRQQAQPLAQQGQTANAPEATQQFTANDAALMNKRRDEMPDALLRKIDEANASGQEPSFTLSEISDPEIMGSLRPIPRELWTERMSQWAQDTKIVDESGALLPMFHGTKVDFNQFRPSSGGKLGPGIYLSQDPEIASAYSGVTKGDVKRRDRIAELEARDPESLTPDELKELDTSRKVAQTVQEMTYPTGKETPLIMPVVARINNPLEWNPFDDAPPSIVALFDAARVFAPDKRFNYRAGATFDQNKADFVKSIILKDQTNSFLRQQGYDGVIWRGPLGIEEAVAFDLDQVKGYFNENPTESPIVMRSRRKGTNLAEAPTVANNLLAPAISVLERANVPVAERPRLIAAAAAMAQGTPVVSYNPVQWLESLQRNPANKTLTRYTTKNLQETISDKVDQVNQDRSSRGLPSVVLPEGVDAKTPYLRTFRIAGIDAGYAVKRVVEFNDDGSIAYNGNEIVGVFSNEDRSVTGIVAPIMLHAIGFETALPLRLDAYDVRLTGAAKGFGKLPYLYKKFGFNQTFYYDFDPNYPDFGETPEKRAEYVSELTKAWTSDIGGNWNPNYDANGNIDNYPGLWGGELALNADQRADVASRGVQGFIDDPSRIRRLANGDQAGVGDAGRGVEVGQPQAVGRPAGPANVPGQAVAAGLPSGQVAGVAGSVAGGATIAAGTRAKVDLATLSSVLKAAGTAARANPNAARTMGRMLAASTLLPGNSGDFPEDKRTELRNLEEQAADLARQANDPNISKDERKNRLAAKNSTLAKARELRQKFGANIASLLGLEKIRFTATKAERDAGVDVGVKALHKRLDAYSTAIVNTMGELGARDGTMSPFMREVLAEAMAHDIHYAMTKQTVDAAQWYRKTIDAMWSNLESVYPEMANPSTAREHRAAFSIALAITSNGERVMRNMELARKAYENWVDTGELNLPSDEDPKRSIAMRKSFVNLNTIRTMVDDQSWTGVSGLLLKQATFSKHNAELSAMRVKAIADIRARNLEAFVAAENQAKKSGAQGKKAYIDFLPADLSEKIDALDALKINDSAADVGYMGAVIGPKIGSFFANLNGRWDTLTADVWFTRTFARIIGNLQIPDNAATNSALRDIVAMRDTEEAKKTGLTEEIVDAPDMLVDWAYKVEDDYLARRKAAQAIDPNNILQKTDLEQAATRLTKALEKSSAAPKSNSERTMLRSVTQRAAEIARERYGHEVDLASAQALLWYVEKELYENYAAGSDTASQDYQQASNAIAAEKKAQAGAVMSSIRRGARGIKDEATLRYIDKYDELRRYVAMADPTGTTIAPINNPYLGARLLQGRLASMQSDAERRYADILRRMHEAGITLEQMDRFLTAQHAEERNIYVASINAAFPDGGSGMLTGDARNIITAARNNGSFARMNGFANEWRMMMQEALQTKLTSGLINQQTYDNLTNRYKNYVPLRGAPVQLNDEDFEDFGEAFGRGLSTSGRGTPSAMGRRSAALGVTSQIGYVHEDTIRRVARNEIGQAFLHLVRAVGDRNMAEVIRPRRRVIQGGAVRFTHDAGWMQDPRNFGLYVNQPMNIGGHDYAPGDLVVIRLNNRRLADALTAPAAELRMLERGLRNVNNAWRFVTTGMGNPTFAPVNLARDLGTGTLSNLSAHGFRDTAQMLRRWAPAFASVFRQTYFNRPRTGSYRDFTAAGGDQLYWRQNDLDAKRVDFEELAARVARRDPNDRTLARTLFGWYPAFFTAAETATRLAQYEQRIATGSTPREAALAARDITVDFAKGGQAKPVLNTWYMFLNAGLQGSVNTLRSVGRSFLLAPSLLALGYAQSVLARMMGGDDEKTGQAHWDNIPEYEKTANLFFFDPRGTGKHIKIPLPYGYNVFVSLGSRIADAVHGRATAGDVMSGALSDSLNAFNPIGGSGIKGGTGNLLASVTPTMLRPLTEIAINQDFTGRAIYPKSFNKFPSPDSANSFASTPDAYIATAEYLNTITGGDPFEPGIVDMSPNTLQYLAGYYFSGAGRNIDRLYTAMTTDEKVTPNMLPLVRSFVGDASNDTRSLSQQYYDIGNDTASTMRRIDIAADKDAPPELRMQASQGVDRSKAQLGKMFADADKEMSKIRRAMKTATPEQRQNLIEVRKRIMQAVIRRRNDLTDAQNDLE